MWEAPFAVVSPPSLGGALVLVGGPSLVGSRPSRFLVSGHPFVVASPPFLVGAPPHSVGGPSLVGGLTFATGDPSSSFSLCHACVVEGGGGKREEGGRKRMKKRRGTGRGRGARNEFFREDPKMVVPNSPLMYHELEPFSTILH